MAEMWMTFEELKNDHLKLKADHEALRVLMDQTVEAMENHIHGIETLYATRTTKPLKRPSPTPLPTPGPTSGQRQAPAAPAERTR